MDCTHRHPIPVPDPPPTAPAPPAAAPQEEATGDSESGTLVSAVLLPTGVHHPSVTDEDDAESCSGGAGKNGVCGGGGATSATATATGDDASDGHYVAVEGEEAEVDSWMAVPWWRRMVVEDAPARDDGGGRCAPAAEGGVVSGAGGRADESNRLFWEACIAHGY